MSVPDLGDRKALLLASLANDLAGETADLMAILSRLGEADWDTATPAAGWTVRDQVTHLAFFDDTALLSLRDRAAFLAQTAEFRALGDRFGDVVAAQHRHMAGGFAREWFASSRARLIEAFRTADPSARLPWYGPDFSVPAAITGRLMETWAHGQDIADAVGVARQPTARLRHVAHIGVRARAFSFQSRGLPVPETPVYVELRGVAPSPAGAESQGPAVSAGSPGKGGERGVSPLWGVEGAAKPPWEAWTWGPAGAADRVTGDALDFCLVVTQRRNVADTGLTVTGDAATAWIAIAQAFAGRPTDPRPPTGPRLPAGSPRLPAGAEERL